MSPYIDWTFLISLVMALGAGLTAWSWWLRDRRRGLPGPDAVLEALKDENAQLHAEMEEHLSVFEQRIEFLERRITQRGEWPPRLPKNSPTTPL